MLMSTAIKAAVLFLLGNIVIIVCILQNTSSCNNSLISVSSSYLQWSLIQLLRSVLRHDPNTDTLSEYLQNIENSIWEHWETNCRANDNDTNSKHIKLQQTIPTINLHETTINTKNTIQNIDLQQPLLLQNIWHNNNTSSSYQNFSAQGLLSKHTNPLSNISLTYFTDATKTGQVETDSISTIYDIVYNMTYYGSPHKIGSQKPIHTYPELIYQVLPKGNTNNIISSIFGNRFEIKHLKRIFFGLLPPLTTVPLFIARLNNNTNSASGSHLSSSSKTELHCEPIGNIAIQLHSHKHWILIPSKYFMLLRPTISKNGRAYFYSRQENINYILDNVPHYKVTTKSGDGLYIPPWMWHRVDYYYTPDNDDDEEFNLISIGASLFHFRFWDFIRNNYLFSMLVMPNLIKELFGNNLE